VRVLVTGGAGFIGSHLVDLLVARDHPVVVLDNLDPQVHGPAAVAPRHLARHLASGAVRFLHGDVTNRDQLSAALADADAVVHLAAAVGVGQSMYEPHYYVHTNCGGTGLLLDLLARGTKPLRKLVVASSMSLYGEGAYACRACDGREALPRSEARMKAGAWEVQCARCGADMDPQPTREEKPPDIASVYAATKKHQEDLAVSFGRAWGIPTFALRLFNVFGPRQSLSNPYTGVAAIFLSRLLSDKPPLVFEDGRQRRDFVDVRDVARALLLAVEAGSEGAHVLNVCTGRPTSVLDVGEALAAHLGLKLAPELLGRYRAGDVRHCYGDPGRAREVLGFTAQETLASGLPALVEWCRAEQSSDGVEASLRELEVRGLVR
jgi:dTDP-L-rhamnose 4-epimerase